MRWMYIRQNPTENLLFGYKKADEVRRQLHLRLWNIYNFFVTYSNADGWIPKKSSDKASFTVLDKWILSRLSETIKNVTTELENYKAHTSAQHLEEFGEVCPANWTKGEEAMNATFSGVAEYLGKH